MTNRFTSDPVIQLRKVVKTYGSAHSAVHALRGVSLTVRRGELVAIVGASGSGKSTLMNVLALLDAVDRGSYRLDGVDVRHRTENELAEIRNRRIGLVFQAFNLLPGSSALRNVELPLVYSGVRRDERERRALEALEIVGLARRARHLPSELSGGEQQRVAVARAVVNDPAIVLADEPTGNLDTVASMSVLEMLRRLHGQGRTIVVITHEHDVAAIASRVVEMRDGRIVADHLQDAPAEASRAGVGQTA
ncbi:MAG: ABC transporter ATP-binding protein [Actinomycetota bacterium]|jgi:putative ABC transport system ATP-binding protein|nr:ABC transporter ATP-binding protein [Actinomycetota bacterium]